MHPMNCKEIRFILCKFIFFGYVVLDVNFSFSSYIYLYVQHIVGVYFWGCFIDSLTDCVVSPSIHPASQPANQPSIRLLSKTYKGVARWADPFNFLSNVIHFLLDKLSLHMLPVIEFCHLIMSSLSPHSYRDTGISGWGWGLGACGMEANRKP